MPEIILSQRLYITPNCWKKGYVNPVARTDTNSPIYGMPILNADKAKNVIVVKRGRGTGFSGIDNALFYLDNARMLYGDGQEVASKLIQEVKQL